MCTKMADAVIEGQQMRGVIMEEEGVAGPPVTEAAPVEAPVAPVDVEVAPAPVVEGEEDLIIIEEEETENL